MADIGVINEQGAEIYRCYELRPDRGLQDVAASVAA